MFYFSSWATGGRQTAVRVHPREFARGSVTATVYSDDGGSRVVQFEIGVVVAVAMQSTCKPIELLTSSR